MLLIMSENFHVSGFKRLIGLRRKSCTQVGGGIALISSCGQIVWLYGGRARSWGHTHALLYQSTPPLQLLLYRAILQSMPCWGAIGVLCLLLWKPGDWLFDLVLLHLLPVFTDFHISAVPSIQIKNVLHLTVIPRTSIWRWTATWHFF